MPEKILTEDVKLNALYSRDESYAGLFFVAVKTTGVFCRMGCPARAPKRENIQFFDTVKEALDAGFRPCKLCKPLERIGQTPDNIRRVMDQIHAGERLSNHDLNSFGLHPDSLRRWFQKHHGITFQAYQRYLKIGRALEQLNDGARVTDAALQNYDSLSGFQESFKNIVGASPRHSAGKAAIFFSRLTSPLGLMMAGAVRDKLCLLEFCDRRMLASELQTLQKLHRAVLLTGHCALFVQVQRQLDEYFSGQRRDFDLPLDLTGTEFQQKVWNALLKIPYGATCSYGEQARKIGQPQAVRAVGRANGMNRIAIVVPCHRVVGDQGQLTGYGGGLERKHWLLKLEADAVRR